MVCSGEHRRALLGCRAKKRIMEAAPAHIRESQRPAMFHRVAPPGIMGLLKQALAAQKGGFRAALCGALRALLTP